MYKRRVGVGAGLISYATLLSGRGGGRNGDNGGPTLILDFVGYTDPNTLQPGDTLDLNFIGAPSSPDAALLELDFTDETYGADFTYGTATYQAYTPDPSQPQSGITSYYVWS